MDTVAFVGEGLYFEVGLGDFSLDREFGQKERFMAVDGKVRARTSVRISQRRRLIFAARLISVDTGMRIGGVGAMDAMRQRQIVRRRRIDRS